MYQDDVCISGVLAAEMQNPTSTKRVSSAGREEKYVNPRRFGWRVVNMDILREETGWRTSVSTSEIDSIWRNLWGRS